MMFAKRELQVVDDAGTVLDQIERVVRWGSDFRLAFVQFNDLRQLDTMRRALLDRLKDRRVLEIILEEPIVSLLDEISRRWNSDTPPDVVCVCGLDKSFWEKGEASVVLGRLNHERELIRRKVPAALLIWLPKMALDYVARGAPDFWAWRSGVYEFPADQTLPPSPLPVLDSSTLQEIVDLITPLMVSQQERTALLRLAFKPGSAVLQHIDFTGPVEPFAINLISTLINYGEIQPGKPAISALLEVVRERVGLDRQTRIDALLQRINAPNRNYFSALSLPQEDTQKEVHRLEQLLQTTQDLPAKDAHVQEISARFLDRLGMLYRSLGRWKNALSSFEKALEIYRRFGDEAGIASALNQIGTIHGEHANYREALTAYQEALASYRKLGDRAREKAMLDNLSALYQAKGDADQASRYRQEALAISHALGEKAASRISGKIKLEFGNRLGDDWRKLADYLEISPADQRRFEHGDEARAIWTWLENRKQLHELPEALLAIHREDLANLFTD